MCLAVPGRVVQWIDNTPTFAQARVDFGGVHRSVSMVCLPDIQIGEYVLVHAGIAIARLDDQEAARVLETLRELGLDDEPDEPLSEPQPGPNPGLDKERPA